MPAQENGRPPRPDSQPSGSASRGTDTRGATSRSAADLDAAVSELRRASTIAAAALIARNVHSFGDDARRALLDLCREKALPDATFQGIVGAFEFERDPSILPLLMEQLGAADASRERYLTDRLRAFDAQRPVLGDLLAELEKAPAAERRKLFRTIAIVVDTPPERMQAARFLVRAFQQAEFQEHAEDLVATLQKITFQRYHLPARWQKWFDDFAPAHPEGFSDAALYGSALREQNERLIAEVKKAINVCVANKQVPEYFNVLQYPEPAIRLYAAGEISALKDAEADVVKNAARVLSEALKTEKNEEVLCALLRSLGTIAENKPEVKKENGASILAHLKDPRDAVAVAALRAMAQAGRQMDAGLVEALYAEAGADGTNRPIVRAQAITTLYSLDGNSPAILSALEDPAAEVRASAARSLSYGKRNDAAPSIARALTVEKNEETQRVLVAALQLIQAWPPEAVEAVLQIAARPGAAREAAVRGLIQAASVGIVNGGNGDRLVALLSEALPVLGAAADKRKALLEDLQKAKGPLAAQVLLRWLSNESQPDAQREIAAALAKVAPSDPLELEHLANELIAAQKPGAAVVILRAAVEQAGAPGAATTQSSHYRGLRISLARALLMERRVEGLMEAEVIATEELKGRPQDGHLLSLRGHVREALGRRFDAADDLRRALTADGVTMADADRQDVECRTAILLADDPKKAKEFIDSLPALPRSRGFLLVHGLVELDLGNVRAAIAQLRAALLAPGKEDSNIVRYRLAEAMLRSPLAKDRLEAKTLLDALQGEPKLPAEYSLAVLGERVRKDAEVRSAVRHLDAAAPEEVSSNLATVIALGTDAVPWLFHELPDLARTEPPATVERRITAARSILFPESGAQPSALAAPPADAPRDAWVDFATRAATWWDGRS